MEKWPGSQAERPRPLIRPVEESLALIARAQRPAPAPEPEPTPEPAPSSQPSGAAAPMSVSEQVAAALSGILGRSGARGGKEAPKAAPPADAVSPAPAPPVSQPSARASGAAPMSVSEQVAAALAGSPSRSSARPGQGVRHVPPSLPPAAPASSAPRIPASHPSEPAAASTAPRIPASHPPLDFSALTRTSAPHAPEPATASRDPAPLAMRPVSASNKLHTREFVFTIEDYENIRRRIYDFAGIALASSKQDMVYGRLAKRLRERRLSTFREYLELIDRDPGEWDIFVNALTTNLTSFFREAHHFELLARRLRQWLPSSSRPFRIWCCAASTGEEPYSLAMTACEAFASLSPPVEIIASDINTQVLIDAREGVYGSERMNGVSEGRLHKFFQAVDGEHSSRWKVIPQLHQLVRFCRINLLDSSWPLHGRFDAIFCRNVMIYFDRETQRAILQRFLGVLEEGGELYAGHSESFLHASDLFTNVGKTVYRPTPTRRKK